MLEMGLDARTQTRITHNAVAVLDQHALRYVTAVLLATAEGAPQLSPGQAGNPTPPLNTVPTLSRRQSMVLMRRNTLSPHQTSCHGSGDEYKPDAAWLLL